MKRGDLVDKASSGCYMAGLASSVTESDHQDGLIIDSYLGRPR